jgi:nucleoside-diphosphate-sugar epimerase|tara:strand:+ start:24964 stop:25845 length:882 start_codon:yes stop_codon:yes gene_type:complete
MSNTIIAGCGFLGRALIPLLISQQEDALCLMQSKQSEDLVLALNMPTQRLNFDQADEFEVLDTQAKDIYYFAPPPKTDDNDQRMLNFLLHCESAIPRRIVYISTSGVYGDCNGDWVNEDAELKPLTSRAKRRVSAESSLLAFSKKNNCEYQILRVGGIYGAERLPLHRLSAIKVIHPQQAPYSNRIHVDDLARVCHAAMSANVCNEIFNVADGSPSSMTDFYFSIADRAKLERPQAVSLEAAKAELSSAMLSFINEARRLDISKMQQLLQPKLYYPDLQAGLDHCFDQLQLKN